MPNLLAKEGKQLLLGNEAITRGLIEAGVGFASTYPGTPSSEVGNNLEKISADAGMYFEFSVNEKVAMEVSAAAAASGVRSFVFMKHVGLNVAADPMMSFAYSGAKGGMLIMSADDPSCHSSQNEQDNRYYASFALLPMVEPSTPQEAKDMVSEAYKISEELELPLIFRTTTRVNHARGVVELGPITAPKTKGHFDKDVSRYVNIPVNSRRNRLKILDLNKKAQEMSDNSKLNFVEGDGDVGIITSGVSYTYVREFVEDASILKIGFTNPLPEKKIVDFIKGKKLVIVVEELEPFMEDQILRICAQYSLGVPVYGKRSGHIPRAWELSPDKLKGISEFVKLKEFVQPLPETKVELPNRPPTLCAGCPHRGSFAAAKKAAGNRDVIYSSDIGCYSLGVQPPFGTADFVICMGGGAGAAGGFSKATDQIPIAIMGDSTFFHSGIPPMVNALFNNHKEVIMVLDNRTTAMTGHQPNPGTGREFGGINTEPVDIVSLVKGLGVKFVAEINPYDVESATKTMKEAIDFDGLAVVVSKCPCPLELKKEKALVIRQTTVDQDKCIKCNICLKTIACPALMRKDDKIMADPSQCIGCGMCASVCPKNAIEVRK